MKSKLLALAFCALPPLVQAAEPPPAVTIDRVLQIARDSLALRHSDAFIQSINLGKPAVFSGGQVWFVKWSHPIPGSRPEVREVGLSVAMDGKVIHIVK